MAPSGGKRLGAHQQFSGVHAKFGKSTENEQSGPRLHWAKLAKRAMTSSSSQNRATTRVRHVAHLLTIALELFIAEYTLYFRESFRVSFGQV
jgi:hypothetical protein